MKFEYIETDRCYDHTSFVMNNYEHPVEAWELAQDLYTPPDPEMEILSDSTALVRFEDGTCEHRSLLYASSIDQDHTAYMKIVGKFDNDEQLFYIASVDDITFHPSFTDEDKENEFLWIGDHERVEK